MSIIQISKIQQRSGNLVDLPQLDEAEFGWATDAKLLYIGKTTPNENIEVLTSYSNISFSQINGAIGNINITAATAGQVLTYDGNNWVNRGGATGGLIDLGDAANVKIEGGSTGYVLETDGTGNLSWTPKTAIVANITNVTQANPGVVTTQTDSYFTNGSLVTITNVNGMTQLNGNSYYAKILTSNTFSLYSDSGLTTSVNTSGYGAYTSNGRAISSITGTGSGAAGGSNTTVQFNNAGVLDGSSSVTWNLATNLFSINGNANVGNLNANGVVTSTRFTSNVATGTAPLTVSSTTRVSNLNVAYANVSDFGVVTSQSTGTYYLTFVNGNSTANYALASNSSISANLANGSITATTFIGNISGTILAPGSNTQVLFNDAGSANATSGLTFNKTTGTLTANLFTGTLTTAAQPNVTSLGTLTSLTVSGNINASNVIVTGYHIRSVGTGISASGSTQGTATALTKEINQVTTVSSSQGVVLPTAVAGMSIIITNTSANSLLVYPASGAAINALATNAGFTQANANSTIQYVATSTTQWYTVGATYA